MSVAQLLVAVLALGACGGTLAETSVTITHTPEPVAVATTMPSSASATPAVTATPSPAPTTAPTRAPTPATPQPARISVTSQSTFCSPGRTTGMVRNDGGSTARVVSVTGRIFLSDGRLWTTGEDLASPASVEPGRSASFEVLYTNSQICLQGVRGELVVTWTGGSAQAVPLRTD